MFHSVSDLWRHGSSDPGVDLKSILDGASVLAESLDQKLHVKWAGTSQSWQNGKEVHLDASPLQSLDHPVPGDVVDIIIGAMAHETGHALWTGDNKKADQWAKAQLSAAGAYSLAARRLWVHCRQIVEDAYVDARIRGKLPWVYGYYLDCARQYYGASLEQNLGHYLNPPMTKLKMLNLWIAHCLYGIPTEVCGELIKLTSQATKVHSFQKRCEIAMQCYEIISKLPQDDTVDMTQGEGEGSDDATGESKPKPENTLEPEDGMAKSATPLDKDTAEAVEAAIADNAEDITSAVMALLGNSQQGTVIVKQAHYNAEAAALHKARTSQVVARLRKSLEAAKHRRERYYRGLKEGKVCGRRLWRVATGDVHVFQRKEQPVIDLSVALTLDMSYSMRKYAPLVLDAAVAFREALSREGIPAVVLGYQGDDKPVVWRLWDKGMQNICLGTEIWNGTPTACALASARTLLRRSNRGRQVVINVTDGEPDDEVSHAKVCKILRGEGVGLIAIAPKGYFKPKGYDQVIFVGGISEVPQGLEKALKGVLNV